MGEGIDSDSPWSRDDWSGGEREPVRFRSPSLEPEPPITPLRTPGSDQLPTDTAPLWGTSESTTNDGAEPASFRRRAIVAGGIVAMALVVIAMFSLGGSDDDPDDAGATATSRVTSEKPERTDPSTTVARTYVPRTTTATTIVTRIVAADGDDAPEVAFSTTRPDLELLEVGSVPEWTEWRIPLVSPFDVITEPTEVVFLSRGAINRLRLPEGVIRSIAVTEVWDSAGQLAVAGDTIALSTNDDVMLVRDGLPVTQVEVGIVNMIRARPVQGDFIVSSFDASRSMGGQFNVLVSPDGAATPIEREWIDEAWPAMMGIAGNGDLLVDAPGGLYAVQPFGDTPPRRITDGRIVGSGRNHLLLHQCNETLECNFSLLDLRTGEASATVPLPEDLLSYDLPRISPDGARTVVMTFADEQSPPEWQIFDFTTGESTGTFELESWVQSSIEPWSADAAGIFAVDGDELMYCVIDGRCAGITGFGSLLQVVSQPTPAPPASTAGG